MRAGDLVTYRHVPTDTTRVGTFVRVKDRRTLVLRSGMGKLVTIRRDDLFFVDRNIATVMTGGEQTERETE